MSEQVWHSWRCIVSLLIAIDTWWGMNSTPLNMILRVDGCEELNSPSSLVLPELWLQRAPFPFHVAKSFCQKFLWDSFLILPTTAQLLQSKLAHYSGHSHTLSLQRSKSSPSALQLPPAWFLCELLAAWASRPSSVCPNLLYRSAGYHERDAPGHGYGFQASFITKKWVWGIVCLLESITPVKCSAQAGEQWEKSNTVSQCQMRNMEAICSFLLFASLFSLP